MVEGGAGGSLSGGPDHGPETSIDAGPETSIETSTAMLRIEADDLDPLLRTLAERLEAVPGLPVQVTKRHGRLRGLVGDLPYVERLPRRNDRVVRIVVTVGDGRHWVAREGTSLRCGVDRKAAGQGTATAHQSVPEWVGELVAAIDRRNSAEREAIAALRHLVEGGRS